MANYLDHDRLGMYKKRDRGGPGPALMGAHTLLGNDVVNGEESDLGDIKEIMLDMRTGRVAYAVLAFGGFLGIGEKLFAVPWQALQLDTEHHRFVLNVPKERLVSAPGFDKHHWPDMEDLSWQESIHDFYGTDMYADRAGGPGVSGGMAGSATAGAGAGTMGAGYAGTPGAAAGGPVPGGTEGEQLRPAPRASGGSPPPLSPHHLRATPLDFSSDDGSGSITHSTYRERDND